MPVERRIALIALMLVFALVGLVAREGAARASGREVLLAIEAIDPRALLTGHYALLSLTDRLPPGQSCPDLRNAKWVALRKDGGRHRYAATAPSRPAAERLGDVAVRGGLICVSLFIPDLDGAGLAPRSGALRDAGGNTITLDIGVDRFHADQDEAEAMAAALRDRRPGEPVRDFAVVSVGQDGRARLKGVILDGRRTDLTWF
jgi:hypothetical protein